jgi:hypothetical protein
MSHQVQLAIPAQAGIQRSAALDTGVRRCDEEKCAACAPIHGRLNIVANQVGPSSGCHSGTLCRKS